MRVKAITLLIVAMSTAEAPLVTRARQQEGRLLDTSVPHDPPEQRERSDPVGNMNGKTLFERHCAVCHGIEGKGGRGPSLNHLQLVRARDDAALKLLIANGIPPGMPQGWFLSEEDVASLARYVRSLGRVRPEPVTGDPVRGKQIYGKSGCSGCHIIAGDGTGYGPELTNVGARRSASYLHQAVVRPSKLTAQKGPRQLDTDATTMPESFLLVEAVTAAGETIRGIRLNEDTFSIQLKDAAGRFYSLRKQNLKELRKLRGETPMPSFEGTLSPSELQDLIAYLASLRGKP
jgi:cytochrome c oxidase cbb3-type subunit III